VNTPEAYTRWSTTYDEDRNLTRDLDQLVTRNVLEGLRCHTVLEIGCGTGKNTRLLVDVGRLVCALDLSVGMLSQARAKIESPRVLFAVADLTKPWPCKSDAFELIVCNLVLEHIAELDRIFSEASRVLIAGGKFFVCELHPYRQYQGMQAHFQHGEDTIKIEAFVHHLSDFTEAAARNGLSLSSVKEWWHEQDQGKPPRLISFMFEKLRRPGP
jgi:ubiquinone/menaquinone biosynthesis C-methylase UbiE